ncbi:DUF4123 domain-containing protein [Pseudomonas sp. 14P_8.1_Bac3]|uniref:DUF4123 domain-containing protein n=1 Tax=Pseudomonas sp. 14P_8.1_Bac3 TaxID=2971621 RepID=UPI0021C9ACAF|nr:DUF4123 domain-containing protein [Pseudomonas sp. 14P_8.1_Bac3]MCU1761192.1 DUF4123 domain-containing protein [Pseudomonas sp. 14P_8.1_Bac3]
MNLSTSLPDDLPWNKQQAFLLLDGTTVTELPERLKALSPGTSTVALYDCPPFNALRDISPLLVPIQIPDEPIFQFYLQHAHEEWGVLLFSHKAVHDVAAHLRKLLTVELPEGLPVVLRLADAAVAQALFGSGDQRLFGPVSCVVTPDNVNALWQPHQPQLRECPELLTPYRLSPQLNAALDNVDRRRALLELDAHLLTYFPERHDGETVAERWPILEKLATEAKGLGLSSQSELLYYANLQAWLDGTAPEQRRSITQLIHTPFLQTPAERVALAADRACLAAMHRSRP